MFCLPWLTIFLDRMSENLGVKLFGYAKCLTVFSEKFIVTVKRKKSSKIRLKKE